MYAGQCDCKVGISDMMMVQFLLLTCKHHLEYAKAASSANKELALTFADTNAAVEAVKAQLEACTASPLDVKGRAPPAGVVFATSKQVSDKCIDVRTCGSIGKGQTVQQFLLSIRDKLETTIIKQWAVQFTKKQYSLRPSLDRPTRSEMIRNWVGWSTPDRARYVCRKRRGVRERKGR
jgi:hypothetical protein